MVANTDNPINDSNRGLWLYAGKVMHARLKPVKHRFNYRVFNILVDLDRLDKADQSSRFFSVGKWNLFSFDEKDHGKRDGSSLRKHIDDLASRAGLQTPHRVFLLCYPRVLGYTFNPLSVYYCHDEKNALTALIYQVHNTFGERHTYVEPVRNSQVSAGVIKQKTDKLFYVSPFMDMEMRYHFAMSAPGTTIRQRILETDQEGPILSATLSAKQIPATSPNFFKALLQTLGLTWKVTFGIHWEALKLWVKGMKLRDRPQPPAPESFAVVEDKQYTGKSTPKALTVTGQ